MLVKMMRSAYCVPGVTEVIHLGTQAECGIVWGLSVPIVGHIS